MIVYEIIFDFKGFIERYFIMQSRFILEKNI